MNIFEVLNTEESRYNFLLGILYLAKADGEISQDERSYFSNAVSGFELGEGYRKNIETLFDAVDYPIEIAFENSKQSRLLIQEGVQLCHMDGKYDLDEQALIYQMAEQLDIDEKIVESIEDWVKEGMAWRDRGNQMITGEL